MNAKKHHYAGLVEEDWNSNSPTVASKPDSKRVPGTPPEGWTKIQFYVPERLAELWNASRDEMPTRSHKLMCTAAMALYVGLPEDIRKALFAWAHRNELHPDKINPDQAVGLTMAALKNLMDRDAVSVEPLTAADQLVLQQMIDLVGPEVQKDGFTERVIRTFVVGPQVRRVARDEGAEGGAA